MKNEFYYYNNLYFAVNFSISDICNLILNKKIPILLNCRNNWKSLNKPVKDSLGEVECSGN